MTQINYMAAAESATEAADILGRLFQSVTGLKEVMGDKRHNILLGSLIDARHLIEWAQGWAAINSEEQAV